MKKFICIKLLAAFSVNLLMVPIVNCGKKRKYCKNSGYSRRYKRDKRSLKHKKFSYKTKKEKRVRKERYYKKLEKKFRKNNDKFVTLDEVLSELGKKFGNSLKFFSKLKLSLRSPSKIRIPKKLALFLFLTLFRTAFSYEVKCRITVTSFFESFYTFFTTKYCEQVGSSVSCPAPTIFPESAIGCKSGLYNFEMFCPQLYAGFATCSCQLGILHCFGISIGSPFTQATTVQDTTVLDITSGVSSIVTPILVCAGCIVLPLSFYCIFKCVVKKMLKKMRITSQKESPELLTASSKNEDKPEGKCRIISKNQDDNDLETEDDMETESETDTDTESESVE
ncbi:hypothetical protein ACFLYU_00085 [Candidatus Dependentiae bacterium]